METSTTLAVTVNAGSSSIKIALFDLNESPKKIIEAVVQNIGQPGANLVVHGDTASKKSVAAANHAEATKILTDWLEAQIAGVTVAAIGHRIVHGGPEYYKPQIIDDTLLAALHGLTLFDPEHMPLEVDLIEEFQKLFPNIKQVACFDTAFHHDLPTEARLLPIPRHFEAKGIRRYGFHGLSYAYVLKELQRLEPGTANGKLVIAHLGSGVSLAAVRNGVSIDTTMALTPAAGVPMSTRSGDLDPGLALYLERAHGYDANKFNNMVNFKSGLLGVSQITSDMEELLDREADEPQAKDAVDLFCYQIKKSIGSLAAALGGIDALVFTGGMGENAPKIRARVCDGLDFLGITIQTASNEVNEPVISSGDSRVTVRVIRTDESSTIALNIWQLINKEAAT